MIITSYDQHVLLLSSEPFGGLRFQSLLGRLGADIVFGIISLIIPGNLSEIAVFDSCSFDAYISGGQRTHTRTLVGARRMTSGLGAIRV